MQHSSDLVRTLIELSNRVTKVMKDPSAPNLLDAHRCAIIAKAGLNFAGDNESAAIMAQVEDSLKCQLDAKLAEKKPS